MPTSTAATTILASSPGLSPPSFTGSLSVVLGRTRAGGDSATSSVRAFLSMPNHFRPIARPGIRKAAASSGRRNVATT